MPLKDAEVSLDTCGLDKAKELVQETVTIMENNTMVLFERERNMNHLGNRAEALEQSSSRFQSLSQAIKRRAQYQNNKMTAFLYSLLVTLVVLVIIIVLLCYF